MPVRVHTAIYTTIGIDTTITTTTVYFRTSVYLQSPAPEDLPDPRMFDVGPFIPAVSPTEIHTNRVGDWMQEGTMGTVQTTAATMKTMRRLKPRGDRYFTGLSNTSASPSPEDLPDPSLFDCSPPTPIDTVAAYTNRNIVDEARPSGTVGAIAAKSKAERTTGTTEHKYFRTSKIFLSPNAEDLPDPSLFDGPLPTLSIVPPSITVATHTTKDTGNNNTHNRNRNRRSGAPKQHHFRLSKVFQSPNPEDLPNPSLFNVSASAEATQQEFTRANAHTQYRLDPTTRMSHPHVHSRSLSLTGDPFSDAWA